MGKFKRKVKGFTLVELLVVMAIISLLLALAIPRYFHSVDMSKEAVLKQNLSTTRDAIDKFYGDQGRYPADLQELVTKKYLRTLPVDPIAESDATWQIVPPENESGGVYDLHSSADGKGSDNKPYSEW